MGQPVQVLRKFALSLPQAEEGISCNKAAFKAGGKAFLFVGSDSQSFNVMVKLRESLPEAAKLAAKQPDHYKVGGHDWMTAVFGLQQTPPAGLLERWIAESYRLLAPKRLTAILATPKPKSAAAEGVRTKAKSKQAIRRTTKVKSR